MAISVVSGSASISINTRPAVARPVVAGANARFTTSASMDARGACRLTGAAGDDPTGWTLGMIQLQWIETNWGYYRGRANGDGSLLVQRARPPARPAQGCRDTIAPGAVFVDNLGGAERTVAAAGSSLPLPMSARLADGPVDAYPLIMPNVFNGVSHDNFLREVQLEFHFCTVLSLMSPAGTFQHLKHFFWALHWQARFTPPAASGASPWTVDLTGGPSGNLANVSPIYDGAPTDRRFAGNLTSATAPNCNAVATAAANTPDIRRSNVWSNFDVRR